jgi:membrane-associated phospholipid phosphatase
VKVPHWIAGLGLRLRTLVLVKMLGTFVGIYGFFLLYFWVMHSRAGHAATVPMTPIDSWIGVSQLALLPYASLWLYVSVAPALALTMAALRTYIAGALTMAGIGLGTFWVFPTTTPSFGVDWSAYPALHFLKATDAGGNAFPSLHVAFAAHTAVVIASELRSFGAPRWVHGGNWIWCVAIVYSTMATRQHVVIDVIGGLLVAWVAVRLCGPRLRTADPVAR